MPVRPFWQRVSLSRSPFDYAKVQAVIGGLIRNKRIYARSKTPGLILDVGCGPNSKPENINLDYGWTTKIDICADITKGIPLPDGHVRGIFSEHCLEHVDLHGALRALREFYRVLQPGGAVRIVVPDLAIYVREYAKSRAGQPFEMPYADGLPGSPWSIDGIVTPAQSVNQIMHAHGHRFIYDCETLSAMLGKVGFVDIEEQQFGTGRVRDLILDNEWRAVESLYIEAVKPG